MRTTTLLWVVAGMVSTYLLWVAAYNAAGDCVALTGNELGNCVSHKNNVGYAAIAISMALFLCIGFMLQRKGRR